MLVATETFAALSAGVGLACEGEQQKADSISAGAIG